jgi:hypothetical protein
VTTLDERSAVALLLDVEPDRLESERTPVVLSHADWLALPELDGFDAPDLVRLPGESELRVAARYDSTGGNIVLVKHESEIVLWFLDAAGTAAVGLAVTSLVQRLRRRGTPPLPRVPAERIFVVADGLLSEGNVDERHVELLVRVLPDRELRQLSRLLDEVALGSFSERNGVLIATIYSHAAVRPSVAIALAARASALNLSLRLEFQF